MNKLHLTAPCGLDCFNCPAYEGNITEDYMTRVSEFLNIRREDTPCKGCRDEQGHCRFATNKHCATWDCVQERNVAFCHECLDFPCKLLMPTQNGAAFPHNMKVYNLCRMKFFGLDKWLDESAEIRKRYFEGAFEVGKGPVLEDD